MPVPRLAPRLAPFALLLAMGCASPPPPAAVLPHPVDIGSMPYIHSKWGKAGEDSVRLRIAVRTFEPKNGVGPTIYLAGAIHIAETSYYEALQRQFDAMSVVLFEGVGRKQSGKEGFQKPTKEKGSTGYRELAHTLNLVCQDEVIAYNRPNFQRADMNWEDMVGQLNAEIAHENGKPVPPSGGLPKAQVAPPAGKPNVATAPPAAAGGTSLDAKEAKQQLEMVGSVVGGQNPLLGASLMLLKMSPAARGALRLTLVTKTVAAASGSISAGSDGMISPRLEKLILTQRNDAAMQALGKILAAPATANGPKSVGVFYGAAHLPGMEKILRERFNYVPTKTLWLTAMTIHPKAEQAPDDMIQDARQ